MNSFVETLNQWGGQFLSFAWPMLWQSSLLIAGLFTVELLFRRKLRASIRYALWLVVLVKLCVPLTLALPTSPAWWLHKTPPPVVVKSLPHYTVTYDNGPLPEIPKTLLAAVVPPKPVMTSAAWLLVVSSIVSSALLLWLLMRWWQIAHMVRRATLSERLALISDQAQKFIGMKLKIRVKLTTNSMSPAVCGLFRPAILIPQSLAENFSDDQLRAVLLHELIHLRRRDVWMNFLQALFQIIYWWHPLVWLANARIRRVREEAVDDAVMLALRDEAEAYAPTLLEVAKLALNRPLASLGLVGILESRHSLRQRIERLVDFCPPRQAGLTLVSLLGILAFTAVAVPMGDGPSPTKTQTAPEAVVPPPTAIEQKTNLPSILIQGFIYQMRTVDFDKIVSDLKFNPAEVGRDPWWSASPEKFNQLVESLRSSGLQPITRPRIQTSNGMPAAMYVGDGTNGLEFDCTPIIAGGRVDLMIQGKLVDTRGNEAATNQFNAKTSVDNHGGIVIRTKNIGGDDESNVVVITGIEILTNTPPEHPKGKPIYPSWDTNRADTSQFSVVQGRSNIVEELHRVRLENVYYDNEWLGFVTGGLENVIANHDPKRKGLQLMEDQTRLPGEAPGQGAVHITIRPPLASVSLADLLDAIVKGADKPIKYSIEDYGVVFSRKEQMSAPMFNRHFKIDTNTFISTLRRTPGVQTNSVSTMAKSLFSSLGVNWESPQGKAIFYSDSRGELFVRATAQDLDTIENAVEVASRVAPQIHIKARFLKVPKGTLDGFENFISITNQIVQSNQVAGLVGILTDKNLRAVLRDLEARPGVETLAEPEVVTLSGRQTQMRATRMLKMEEDVIFDVVVKSKMPAKAPEAGPILDAVPYVSSDGYTINLTLIPSLTEPLVSSNSVPKKLPGFRVWQVVTTLNLWDNQTAIISELPEKDYVDGKEVFDKSKASDTELLIFVTATLVDRAGNRFHSDDELPFAHGGIPPQPQPTK